MFEIGRICVKIAGRDSNKVCVVVDVVDASTVLIDGQTRRRKCNVKHLEPIQKMVELNKGASHGEVKKALSALGIDVLETKPKKAESRLKRVKMNKQGIVDEKKDKKNKKDKKVDKKEKQAPVKKADKADKKE
jgi:large subunit ribosomal protein L14e